MPYCERCERGFRSQSSLDQHERDSQRHNICHDCALDFSTWRGLKEHWVQSPNHSYCQYCDEHFDDFSELQDHNEESHSYCPSCDEVFANEDSLQKHYRQSSLHYCSLCKRDFQSENNLKAMSHQYDKLLVSCLLINTSAAPQLFHPSSKGCRLPCHRLWNEVRLPFRTHPSSRKRGLQIWYRPFHYCQICAPVRHKQHNYRPFPPTRQWHGERRYQLRQQEVLEWQWLRVLLVPWHLSFSKSFGPASRKLCPSDQNLHMPRLYLSDSVYNP